MNGEWVTSEMVLCCARMLCCEWVLCARDADEMCGARCSRHVVSGACGVDRHPVCPSQGQRRGHRVYWSLPSLCLSQPRAEERARVAWRGVGGLAWFLSVSPRTRKTQRRVTCQTAAAASQCMALVTPPTTPLCMCARAWAGDGMRFLSSPWPWYGPWILPDGTLAYQLAISVCSRSRIRRRTTCQRPFQLSNPS